MAPDRLSSLTGLRAIAALAVFVFHLGWQPTAPGLVRPYLWLGPPAVSLFFVLSGVVLAWSADAWPERSAARFWQRRFARIWPAHAVALAGAVVFAVAIDAPRRVVDVASQLLLVSPWLFDDSAVHTLNSVNWSLASEGFFYLLFPLLIVVLPGVRSVRANVVLLAACVIGTIGTEALVTLAASEQREFQLSYYFPPARVFEFVAGIALARLLRAGAVPRIPLAVPVALWLLAATTIESAPGALWFAGWTLIPTLVLLAAFARADLDGRPTGMANRLMVRGGEASYCFYLVHYTVIAVVWHVLDVAQPTPVAVAGAAVLSVAATWALHVGVERPCERILRGRSRRAGEPAADGVAVTQPAVA